MYNLIVLLPSVADCEKEMFKILGILCVLVVIFIVILIFWEITFKRQYWLRTKGFWAGPQLRYGIKYEEMRNGHIEHLLIPGNIEYGETAEIYVPSNKEWQETMPEWAKWRKGEILERAKIFCSSQTYEYQEVSSQVESPSSEQLTQLPFDDESSSGNT